MACFFFICFNSLGQDVVVYKNSEKSLPIGQYAFIFIDSFNSVNEGTLPAENNFKPTKKSIPVFQVNDFNVWMRFNINNESRDSILFLNLQYTNISEINVFHKKGRPPVSMFTRGNALPIKELEKATPNFVFPVSIRIGDTCSVYFKVSSRHPLLFPLFIENPVTIQKSQTTQTIIISIYIGIILALLFYNLFLFTSTRDRSYLIYSTYLFFLGLAQLSLSGYGFKFLWPELPWVNYYTLIVTSALAGISGVIFAIYFLRVKIYTPRIYPFLILINVSYVTSIILSLIGKNYYSYQILNYSSLIGVVTLIGAAAFIGKKGFKPAIYYLIAGIVFLLGMIVFVLRNLDVLPYNTFTTNVLYAGSAIEAILLSIALADKINVLRKEKEVSQLEALRISQENEKLVRGQNIELESKVDMRTEELSKANDRLKDAIISIQDAQIQLVEAEKMASLGQLTAGIAHEINNPINFVKSNIKPLTLDINDLVEIIDAYGNIDTTDLNKVGNQLEKINKLKADIDLDFIKAEIYNLLKGIEEGANRTAEIVRSLRIFSRLDEGQLKMANVHDGLDSTLVLLKSSLPDNVEIVKHYNAEGNIECYPGKLNQVFMNIISNSVHAIILKGDKINKNQITISTFDTPENEIVISIKDTGPGMSPEIKQKIFEPFFTTKDVGEGTGLGLAITFKIIQEHKGKVDVISGEGNGADFIITLNHAIPANS